MDERVEVQRHLTLEDGEEGSRVILRVVDPSGRYEDRHAEATLFDPDPPQPVVEVALVSLRRYLADHHPLTDG